MKYISLLQLKSNQKAKVVDILGGMGLNKRLSAMGIHKGRDLMKLSHIGLRGPVVIKIGSGILALGHGVAAKIMVEVL